MSYRIKESEPVPDAIKRISLDQTDRALDCLELKTRNKDRAVHDARVCFKKIRAVLRLVRSELGEDIFRLENKEYRDAGRKLSAARDTTVIAGTLEELVHSFNKQLTENKFKSLRKHLRRARTQINRQNIAADLTITLTSARKRVETWPINSESFSALRPGLQRSYKRGRRCFVLARARRTTENFHEWRKQVKYLMYQAGILNAMWPKSMDALGRELSKLSDYLSEVHDLAMLKQSCLDQIGMVEDASEIEKLVELITDRCAQLEIQAEALGACIYAERPRAFANRMQQYWQSWRPSDVIDPVKAEQMLLSYEATTAS